MKRALMILGLLALGVTFGAWAPIPVADYHPLEFAACIDETGHATSDTIRMFRYDGNGTTKDPDSAYAKPYRYLKLRDDSNAAGTLYVFTPVGSFNPDSTVLNGRVASNSRCFKLPIPASGAAGRFSEIVVEGCDIYGYYITGTRGNICFVEVRR
jgi:hypothetical protein